MGKIIAVVSGKGGTGKTSFTSNTGIALAVMGYSTLCLDFDISMRNLDLALGLSDRALMDFTDVLENRCPLKEAVVTHDKYSHLGLLTAPVDDRDLQVKRQQLRTFADEIRASYDYCLIDAPAGLGLGFQMAITMADQIVVVTTMDQSALRDAQRTVMELEKFSENNLHLIVGRVQKNVLRTLRTTIDDAIDTVGAPLLGVVPEDKDMSIALNQGIPLREVNNYAARAYDNIAKRITGKRVALMNL